MSHMRTIASAADDKDPETITAELRDILGIIS